MYSIPVASLTALIDPSGAASIKSDLATGITPDWYSGLPLRVKSYLTMATAGLSVSVRSSITTVVINSTLTATTITTTSDPTSSAPTTSATISPSGLSEGARIAIGILVPLLALSTILSGFIFIRYHKLRMRTITDSSKLPQHHLLSTATFLPQLNGPLPEVPTREIPVEIDGRNGGVVQRVSEGQRRELEGFVVAGPRNATVSQHGPPGRRHELGSR
ncbi:MAG: hypothetical protein M1814_004099 [Vezdaea aestivalis]|nr:MAG: hypothetical protein M1814_004099 [Vezdaea aestivalis]